MEKREDPFEILARVAATIDGDHVASLCGEGFRDLRVIIKREDAIRAWKS